MATASDVIVKAIDLMDDGGWCKGSYAVLADGTRGLASDDNAIAYCADGALYAAARVIGDPALYHPAREAVMREVEFSIPLWNDHPDRTFGQVRETFRRAAYSGMGSATEEASQVVAGAA